jgi:hypothetical protein
MAQKGDLIQHIPILATYRSTSVASVEEEQTRPTLKTGNGKRDMAKRVGGGKATEHGENDGAAGLRNWTRQM